jgi:CRISP-associated protein Cas1
VKVHLNTLFVTREDTYLAKDGAAVDIRQYGQSLLRVPLHNLNGIVALGWDIGASSALMAACAEAGVTISFCSPFGRFQAAVRGFTPGNVLLRKAQYRGSDSEQTSLAVAIPMVAAKIANCRTLFLRAKRDHGENPELQSTARFLAHSVQECLKADSLGSLRGLEGDAASRYFDVFPQLIKNTEFIFAGRIRRPPTDPVNALLSFSYSLLAHDCRSALESVGLDAAVGFLHRDRPGRPSLALDLMEEFRPVLADRCVLAVLNRKELQSGDFLQLESGACELKDAARKKFLVAWQERKQETITHPFLGEKITIGLLPFIQARLLARMLRNDLDAYPAFLLR